MVAALSVKPFSPMRPCFNDPETAAGSQFSSVPRESLLRITATHWPAPTHLCSSSNSRAGRQSATALSEHGGDKVLLPQR